MAGDLILAIPIIIVSALAVMAAHIPLSCLADDNNSNSKRHSSADVTQQHARQDHVRKSSSLPLPPIRIFRQNTSASDRRSLLSSPRLARPAATSSSRSLSTPSLSLLLSCSLGSHSNSSTQISGLGRDTESYILATPPPRPGYSQNHLIVQIQRLTSRHVLPVFNVKKPVTLPAPVMALQKVILPKKLSATQFVLYSCHDIEHDTHTAVVHAASHELKFGHFSGLSWRLRTDGVASSSVIIIAVSERDGQKTLGRWIPSKEGASGMPPSAGIYPAAEGSWHFIVKGDVLATLQGNRVDIAPAAADISRKGYLGRLRFEEAIVLSSVFIENMSLFGRPPQVEPERSSVAEE